MHPPVAVIIFHDRFNIMYNFIDLCLKVLIAFYVEILNLYHIMCEIPARSMHIISESVVLYDNLQQQPK